MLENLLTRFSFFSLFTNEHQIFVSLKNITDNLKI